MQFLHIGRRPIIEDHQIDGQLLQPPVFVSPQKLPDKYQILLFGDAYENDGQIAGNALCPKCGGFADSALQDIRSRP